MHRAKMHAALGANRRHAKLAHKISQGHKPEDAESLSAAEILKEDQEEDQYAGPRTSVEGRRLQA